jgi:CBS domain-containing protein
MGVHIARRTPPLGLFNVPREERMNVATILRQKGRAVTTASPATTLLDIGNKLAAKRIGAIVIVGPKGTVAGIISERDIIRCLSVHGPECLTRPVSESMTREVISCQESDTLDELMAMMTTRRFRHLPVMTDGALVGIVSIGDVVKHHVAEVTMEATAMREYITHS